LREKRIARLVPIPQEKKTDALTAVLRLSFILL
jgi:antitoxin (DNA-binding transcriptional repressor) of toxin-antitoxin stability system